MRLHAVRIGTIQRQNVEGHEKVQAFNLYNEWVKAMIAISTTKRRSVQDNVATKVLPDKAIQIFITTKSVCSDK